MNFDEREEAALIVASNTSRLTLSGETKRNRQDGVDSASRRSRAIFALLTTAAASLIDNYLPTP
jgi:hypothetical protein